MRYGYDFEAYEWTKPLCVAIVGNGVEDCYYDETKRTPDSVAEACLRLMRAIIATDSDATFWAHNGGKYDALLLLDWSSRHGLSARATPAAGRLIKTEIDFDGATIKLFDSYAVVQASLEKAAKGFDCASRKQFAKSDYSVDMRLLPREKVLQGCIVDARIVCELLDNVESQLESWGGQLKTTFSSSAFSVLSHCLEELNLRFPSHNEKGKENCQWANEVAREAYYGGRVEVFHHNPPDSVRVYDVNSSYPWSLSQQLPFELLGRALSEKSSRALLDEECAMEGVVRAQVEVPHMHLPLLPYRHKEGMFFPVGRWEGWYTAVELRKAIQHGCKVKAKDAILYKRKTPFADFVERVYLLKRTSTGAKREFAKLLLNGCYGKLGMSPEREVLHMFDSEESGLEHSFSNEGRTRFLSKDTHRFVIQDVFFWPKSTHYAMASYVTAYSRMLLWQYMRNSAVAYCDTDSVHDMSAVSNLERYTGDSLGLLKYEGLFKSQYYAPKLYKYVNESTGAVSYKSKGFPVRCDTCRGNDKAEIACEECAKIFKRIITAQEVEQPRMQLANGQFRNGGIVKRLEGTLAPVKRWAGLSKKRFARKDGSTRPWSVDEIERGEPLKMKSPLL